MKKKNDINVAALNYGNILNSIPRIIKKPKHYG